MPKGKHAKPGYYSKPKLKKAIFIVMLSVVVLGVAFSNIKAFEITEEHPITQVAKTESIEITEASSEPQENVEEEPPVVEPSEDEDIKAYIQTKMQENNLTENNFSFFYYNIDDKKYYFYNENKYFTAASTVKVPIAMLYYDRINEGKLSLDSTLTYSSGTYEAGGGSTASRYSVGDKIPISFLLNQSVVNSDNTAVNILIKNLGSSAYRKEITKYSDETFPDDFYTSNITSAAYGYDVMNYLYQNMDSYTTLIEDMKKSSMGQYLKKYITDYDVAHKYGSYSGYVHDYGIVFGKKTYLVGVFTKNVTNSAELIALMSSDILNYTLGNLKIVPSILEENSNIEETSYLNNNLQPLI